MSDGKEGIPLLSGTVKTIWPNFKQHRNFQSPWDIFFGFAPTSRKNFPSDGCRNGDFVTNTSLWQNPNSSRLLLVPSLVNPGIKMHPVGSLPFGSITPFNWKCFTPAIDFAAFFVYDLKVLSLSPRPNIRAQKDLLSLPLSHLSISDFD